MRKDISIGEKYGPAMLITDREKADAYFEECVQHSMEFGYDRVQAERVERQNIGYYAGYYDGKTLERVCRLFRTVHPFFGTKMPTPEEALEIGKKWGRGEKIPIYEVEAQAFESQLDVAKSPRRAIDLEGDEP